MFFFFLCFWWQVRVSRRAGSKWAEMIQCTGDIKYVRYESFPTRGNRWGRGCGMKHASQVEQCSQWLYFQILASCCTSDTEHGQLVTRGRRITPQSCEWDTAEVSACYWHVLGKCLVRRQESNLRMHMVSFHPDHIAVSTHQEEKKQHNTNPIAYCEMHSVGRFGHKHTNICRLIFIHKCHMLCLPWATPQQSVWVKPSTVVSRRLLSGRRLHINSFMSVCLCAYCILNLAYFLPLLFFFYIFRTPIKNGWELYLVQGNSLCQSTVGLEWMSSAYVCVCFV